MKGCVIPWECAHRTATLVAQIFCIVCFLTQRNGKQPKWLFLIEVTLNQRHFLARRNNKVQRYSTITRNSSPIRAVTTPL